ncbi:DUF3089 domain-containing protein [Sphingomonas sp. NFR15]|uniref:DUF3089 domain-containing protein n=1 Tax=Sphingomonas sp. NFR15 TaxID=1566282 RepID=UPI0008894484|nr:DUF3089 domain-containing protein [Sphingomonas sp. NFR15]SDA12861.1 Protein of unknown function [Sphingomonas sp. NFR15]
MARKFLYAFAVLIMLTVAGGFALNAFPVLFMRMALVPDGRVDSLPPPPSYDDAEMWLARPDKAGNPALWTPPGYTPGTRPHAAVFFIHPTSYLVRTHWNAPLDDPEANARATIFLKGQASAFNGVGAVWAPRYRQAAFGAFLTSQGDAQKALDFAYRDVVAAFDAFVREAGDRPIILAGHSQGGLHLSRLLHEKIAGTPLAKRIVAAYVVGWPVSRTADLPLMGLPECTRADQPGCILSWQSFAEPADPSLILDTFDASTGYTGARRNGTAMICTNPITGTPDATAPAAANLGTLLPTSDLSSASISAGQVGARCAGRGLLMIGTPPPLGGYVLPGNNYHVYDYGLFWANVRADAARRLAAYQAQSAAPPKLVEGRIPGHALRQAQHERVLL